MGQPPPSVLLPSSLPLLCEPTCPPALGPSVGGCGISFCRRAAEPFVETDMAEARLAQRHERALLDPAAEVSGLGVPHDLTWVADGLEIAGDEFVERRSFRAGNFDDSVSRRGERHLGDNRSNVVRRDGLEQAGRKPNRVSIRT